MIYHWVCEYCATSAGRREEKTLGWGVPKHRTCAECFVKLDDNGRGAHYVAARTGLVRSGVTDDELTKALSCYGATAGSLRSVHHTLPCMAQTGCGILIEDGFAKGEGTTYDYSRTTCDACLRACTESAKNVQQQAADAAWLKGQGEDFASLRALVVQVNASESRLVGNDPPFGGRSGNTRARYVKMISEECERLQTRVNYLSPPLPSECKGTPAGGLCHDDAAHLIDLVRTSVKTLRAGQAWPDDARRVAADLETAVDGLVGKRMLAYPCTADELITCDCGVALSAGQKRGDLCSACQKAAWSR